MHARGQRLEEGETKSPFRANRLEKTSVHISYSSYSFIFPSSLTWISIVVISCSASFFLLLILPLELGGSFVLYNFSPIPEGGDGLFLFWYSDLEMMKNKG